MRKSLLKFYGCALLCLAFQTQGVSQRACTETLNQAQDEFEEGHLYVIPSMLKDCLDKGLTDEERIQAYWLLTQTYLVIDDPISAENSYLELLKLDPEYVIDEENDPIEIVYLSKKFTTTPIFEFTIFKAGVNFSKPSIIHEYGIYGSNSTKEHYSWGTRYQMGPAAAFNINADFSLNLELLFSLKQYSSITSLFPDDSSKYVDVLEYNEKQTWVDIPLYVRYQKTYGKWTPYVYGGASFNFLLSAKASTIFDNNELSGTNSSDINDKKISDQRQMFNTSWLAGIGTRYRVGYRYFSLEARYNGGLTNVLNTGNQYLNTDRVYNSELLFKNPRVDSDFRMNSISIMAGYVWPLYKPRRIEDKLPVFKKLLEKIIRNEQE